MAAIVPGTTRVLSGYCRQIPSLERVACVTWPLRMLFISNMLLILARPTHDMIVAPAGIFFRHLHD
jgi:hypothetical protein